MHCTFADLGSNKVSSSSSSRLTRGCIIIGNHFNMTSIRNGGVTTKKGGVTGVRNNATYTLASISWTLYKRAMYVCTVRE